MKTLLDDRDITMPDTIAKVHSEKPENSHFFAVGAAHYWLLRGGAQRGLGQSVLAATSFRHAGEAHAPPAFRAGVANLAAATEAHGWAPSEGPLSTTTD